MTKHVDIGILTIRDDEFRAVLGVFPEKVGIFKSSRREYTLRHADAGSGERYKLAVLRQFEQGNGEAQNAVRDLLEDLAPKLVLVVGIARGLPSEEVRLGDVVLSTRILDFTIEERKAGEETTYSTAGGPISKAIAAAIVNLPGREDDLGDWTSDLPPQPTATWTRKEQLYGPDHWIAQLSEKLEFHYGSGALARAPIYVTGPIASSDRVVGDPKLLFPWLATARDIIAVEMESCGVFRAAHDRCPMLTIRGISDIVGLKRDKAWTKFACASAAAFTRAFLRTRPVEVSKALDERSPVLDAADEYSSVHTRHTVAALELGTRPLATSLPRSAAVMSAQQLVAEFEAEYGKALRAELIGRMTRIVSDMSNPVLVAQDGAILGDSGQLATSDGALRVALAQLFAKRTSLPFQIPLATPQFTDREAERSTLRRFAQTRGESAPTIVCIHGMGGVGKSALAVQFAHDEGHRFLDGILWADLRLQDIGTVLDSFARAYGEDLRLVKDRLAKAAIVRSILGTKDALVILDNAEPDTELGLLLPTTGRCLTLVTTRYVDLPALRGAVHLPLELFSEAETLYHIEHVLGERLAPEDRASAQALAVFCGHLPLAIDIVARLLKRASIGIRDFSKLAITTSQTLELMHESERSVIDCFDLAWSQLKPRQRTLFASSSILGGSSLGVDGLRCVSGLSELEIRIVMGELVAASLVTITGSGRYRLHPLLREYAATQLKKMGAGHFETCRIHAAEYFLDLLRSELGGDGNRQIASAQLEAEFENILTAFRLALSSKDEAHGVALALEFSPYLFQQGHWELCDEVLGKSVMVSTVQGARHLLMLRRGELLRERAEYDRALPLLEACETYYRQVGEQTYLAKTLREMGELRRVQRDYAASLQSHKECLDLRRQTSDKDGVAQSLHDCGLVERILGNYELAIEHFQAAIRAVQHILGSSQLSYSTLEIGITLRMLSKLTEAEASVSDALARFRGSGDKRGQAYALRELGELFLVAQNYDGARRNHAESLQLRLQLGDRRGQAVSLYMLGVVEQAAGNCESAMKLYLDSVRIAEVLRDRLCLALNRVRIGELAELRGSIGQAREYWMEARQLFVNIGISHYKEAKLVQQHISRTDGVAS